MIGLDKFLDTLNQRKDVEGRERGLITGTVSLEIFKASENNVNGLV